MTPEQLTTAIQAEAEARLPAGYESLPATAAEFEALQNTFAAALGLPPDLAALAPQVGQALLTLHLKRLIGPAAGAVQPTELKTVWRALVDAAGEGGTALPSHLGLAGPLDILQRVPGVPPDGVYDLDPATVFYDWRIRSGDCADPPIPTDFPSPKRGVCPSCDQPVALNAARCRLCGEWAFLVVGPVMQKTLCGGCLGDGLSRDRSRDYCSGCNGHGHKVLSHVFDLRNGQQVARLPSVVDAERRSRDYRTYVRRLHDRSGWRTPGPPIHRGYKKRWFGLF